MIRGMHGMFYSSEAAELRAFLRDKLGFPAKDVGDGWLIFDMAEADLGVHPTDFPESPPSGTMDLSFTTDDVEKTVRELKERGVEFVAEVENTGYGLVTYFRAPGVERIQLYQPLYEK